MSSRNAIDCLEQTLNTLHMLSFPHLFLDFRAVHNRLSLARRFRKWAISPQLSHRSVMKLAIDRLGCWPIDYFPLPTTKAHAGKTNHRFRLMSSRNAIDCREQTFNNLQMLSFSYLLLDCCAVHHSLIPFEAIPQFSHRSAIAVCFPPGPSQRTPICARRHQLIRRVYFFNSYTSALTNLLINSASVRRF
jgi:hypothetical protein